MGLTGIHSRHNSIAKKINELQVYCTELQNIFLRNFVKHSPRRKVFHAKLNEIHVFIVFADKYFLWFQRKYLPL